jgi:hypothetical protein
MSRPRARAPHSAEQQQQQAGEGREAGEGEGREAEALRQFFAHKSLQRHTRLALHSLAGATHSPTHSFIHSFIRALAVLALPRLCIVVFVVPHLCFLNVLTHSLTHSMYMYVCM